MRAVSRSLAGWAPLLIEVRLTHCCCSRPPYSSHEVALISSAERVYFEERSDIGGGTSCLSSGLPDACLTVDSDKSDYSREHSLTSRCSTGNLHRWKGQLDTSASMSHGHVGHRLMACGYLRPRTKVNCMSPRQYRQLRL